MNYGVCAILKGKHLVCLGGGLHEQLHSSRTMTQDQLRYLLCHLSSNTQREYFLCYSSSVPLLSFVFFRITKWDVLFQGHWPFPSGHVMEVLHIHTRHIQLRAPISSLEIISYFHYLIMKVMNDNHFRHMFFFSKKNKLKYYLTKLEYSMKFKAMYIMWQTITYIASINKKN